MSITKGKNTIAGLTDGTNKANKDLSNVTTNTPSENTSITFKDGEIKWGKASAENDGITVHENSDGKLEVLGMIDAVDSTQVRKQAYVTQEWYDEHYANHTLVEGVEYITPSQVSSNVKSFRNVSNLIV